ncbi:MAG: hypothetical protein IKE58_06495 [Blautia sp.]|nr:hypothetical protein [Blautia sp.]
MFRINEAGGRYELSEDCIRFLSEKASLTIAQGIELLYDFPVVGDDFSSYEKLNTMYDCFYDGDFFRGIGSYFGKTDEETGKEILARKIARMHEKLLSQEYDVFDLFEELIFHNMILFMEKLQEMGKIEYPIDKAAERETTLTLFGRYGVLNAEARELSAAVHRLYEMGLKDDGDVNLFFWDDDYDFFWTKGFVEGIRMMKGPLGEQLGYGYQSACDIFEDIHIIPPVRLLGSEEGNRIWNEQARRQLGDQINLFANVAFAPNEDVSTIERVARMKGLDAKEVEKDIQEMIDILWTQPLDETVEQMGMKKYFEGRKPTVEELIRYIAGRANQIKPIDDDLPSG